MDLDDWHVRDDVPNQSVAIKIITAQEACQRTQEHINKNVSVELTKVMQKIHEEIKVGSFELCENGSLYASTIEKLRGLGYIVSCDSSFNEPYYTISWEPEEK